MIIVIQFYKHVHFINIKLSNSLDYIVWYFDESPDCLRSESVCCDVNYMPFIYCNASLYCLSRRNSSTGSVRGFLVEYFLLRCILRDLGSSLNQMFLIFRWITGNRSPKEGDSGITVVKVLCYKSEGRWFDPRWCHWIFHWHKIHPIAPWPWGRLSFLQEWLPGAFPGGKGGRCVKLTTYHHPVPLSRNLGTLTSWNPLAPSGPVTVPLYLYLLLT